MGEEPLTTSPDPPTANAIDPDRYCRDIETYLCRKNGGHLIRIVGPSFDRVRGWAERGIPLTIVLRGIDRHFERYEAKDRRNRRRRPIRIDFCEDDVLDVFDEWRRAVGIGLAGDQVARAWRAERRNSLPAHLERAIARLSIVRGQVGPSPADQEFLESIVRELDLMRPGAASLRGERRAAVLRRLGELDAALDAWARCRCPGEALAAAARDADERLAAYRERMAEEVYGRTRDACITRTLREQLGIPVLTLE